MQMPPFAQTWIDVVHAHIEASLRGDATDYALADRMRRESAHVDCAMSRAVTALELSAEEELVAWCLVANELDTKVGVRLEAMSSGTEPTVGVLASLVYRGEPARALDELSARGRLVRFALVESADPHGATCAWSRRRIRASDRLLALALLADTPALDPALAGIVARPTAPALDMLAVAPDTIARLRKAVRSEGNIVIATGARGLGRRTSLVAACAEAGVALLDIDCRRLATDGTQLRSQLCAIARECRLLGLSPLLANVDAVADTKLVEDALLAHVAGRVFATSSADKGGSWQRPVVRIELRPPDARQRARLWREALGRGTDRDAQIAADLYPVAPALVGAIARTALAYADGESLTADDIASGARAVVAGTLGDHAHLVEVTQSWDDLVLGPEQITPIVELLSRVRNRRRVYEEWGLGAKVGKGLGTTALFSGPPGTGKTMVAGLIARDLGLPLYQVDVSKISSKWIGETEKHLGELFDAAEAGFAVLLFDEADSLFGKRTELKSSNDRYANSETNYLLQRIERYRGICILTTNHASNIDAAFQRRLSVHVRFELPESAERARLWRTLVPPGSHDAIDFEVLAQRFELAPGHIRNAVVRAAFLAADDEATIGEAHLFAAAKLELESIGRIAA